MAVAPATREPDVDAGETARQHVGLPDAPLEGDRWTWRDLEHIDDDRYRYEVVDGLLVMNARPRIRHQLLVDELVAQLKAACPPDLVPVSGVGVVLPSGDATTPDVSVLARELAGQELYFGPPALVVEVLSRSTRAYDLETKRRKYAELGVPSYWLVDADEPWLLELRLTDDGTYAETRHDGPGPHRLALPFPVAVDLRLT